MTYPITRLGEAIVEKLATDPILASLTGDGTEDSRGTRHHIGTMLNAAGAKERNPFLGIYIAMTVPVIPDAARAHIFRSVISGYVFSKDECLVNQIADRLQYLLTTPEDDNCNGFLDFSNEHIWNYNTEFEVRMPGDTLKTGYNKGDETYSEIIEFTLIWSDVPCGEIVEPECEVCEIPMESPYDVICYYEY